MPIAPDDIPRVEDQESAAIIEEITHSQSTHGLVFSNSIGQAILTLKQKFNYQSNEEAYNDTCNALRQQHVSALFKSNETPTFMQKEWDSAVETLLALTLEPVNEFDTLTLAIPVSPISISPLYKQMLVTFPLKEIVPLVWQGVNNSIAYSDHYMGSDEEKIEQAKRDLPDRIQAFFRTIQRIQKGICHHGVRNELISVLNKTHQGISIIESAEGFVLTFVKEKIHTLFWDAYAAIASDTREKKELLKCLILWIIEDDPSELLKLLDPTRTLLPQLERVFYDHGIEPSFFKIDEMTLGDYVDAIATSLAFHSDMNEQNPLYQLYVVLRLNLDETHIPFHRESIEKIQNWIITGGINIDAAYHRCHLFNFYQHCVVSQALLQYGGIVEISGYLDGSFLKALNDTVHTYFMTFLEYVSPNQNPEALTIEFIDNKNTLMSAIHRCKSEKIVPWVERFFSRWYENGSVDTKYSQCALYAQLLNPMIQKMIQLTDKDLSLLNQQIITLDMINRIFLMAILIGPEEWTSLFSKCLYKILHFVKNELKINARYHFLKWEVYPSSLIDQFSYLYATYQQRHSLITGTEGGIVRPVDMLLMPENIRTFAEWVKMMGYLGKDSIIYLNKWKNEKNRIFHLFLNNNRATFSEFLIVVPTSVETNAVKLEFSKLILNKIKLHLHFFSDLSGMMNLLQNKIESALLLYRSIVLLSPNHSHLLTHQNLPVLMEAPYSGEISKSLCVFWKVNPTFIIDEEIFKLIASNSIKINNALCNLIDHRSLLANEQNCRLICRAGKYTEHIARGLLTLHRHDPRLVNDNHRQLLERNAFYAWTIARGITILYSTHPVLLDDENLELLNKHPKEADSIAEALKALYQESPNLVNASTREAIFKNYNTARVTARPWVLSHRYNVDLASITQAPLPAKVPFYPSPLHEQVASADPDHPMERSMIFQ